MTGRPSLPSGADLLGAWAMTGWTQTYRDGTVQEPMGSTPDGRLVYTADGTMIGVIGAADRAPFVTGGQWNASTEERAAAYSTFLAYSGRYTVEDGFVTHHVEVSLFPNWVGGIQRRRIELDGDTLALTGTIEPGTDQERVARLEWRRVTRTRPQHPGVDHHVP